MGIHLKMYEDVSEDIKASLDPLDDVSWWFFRHLETERLFPEVGDERDEAGHMALHYATKMKLPEIVKALIAAEVDVNAVDRWKCTALHHAALYDRCEIGRILIEAGAEVHAFDAASRTPSDVANEHNNPRFVLMIMMLTDL